jgi:hypothetical protein
MEKYKLEHDVKLICLRANSFPDGIPEAHRKLHALLTKTGKRNYYGVSRPGFPDGNIIYWAAAEQLDDQEAVDLGCENYTIKKGTYLSVLQKNYSSDTEGIQLVFKKLISDPRVDPEGECVEMILGPDEMRCMVRLK